MQGAIRRFFLLSLICFIYPTLSISAPDINDAEAFEIEHANKKYDAITLKLSTENLNPKTLNTAIIRLSDLAQKAENCVQKTKDEIADLNGQLKQMGAEAEQSAERVDTNYLQKQKQELSKRQAQCRLFVIRANEALAAYKETSLSLRQEITFSQGPGILSRLKQLPADWKQLNIPPFDSENLKSTVSCIFYAIPFFLIAVVISWRLQLKLKRKAKTSAASFLFNTILIFLASFFLGNLFFLQVPFVEIEDNQLYQNVIINALCFVTTLFFYHLFFALKRLPAMLQWYGFDVVFLKRLGLVVISFYFLNLIGLDVLLIIDASKNSRQLFEDFTLVLSLGAMIYFTLSLYHSHSHWFNKNFSGKIVYQAIFVIVAALLVLDFIGFSILAVNSAAILYSFLLTSALGTVLYLGINNAYSMLSYNPHYLIHMKRWFGYNSKPPFLEMFILKILAQIVVILGTIYLFAHLIGEASYFIDGLFTHLVDGFGVGGFKIYPLQWLLGILIFALLSLASRHISNKISRSQQFDDDEEEKQVAIASIVLYVGFAMSMILGLIMAGFSFTSLAIIAGALSVGIGLGLQSIVNNFFSGLILLIEKPIKAGDRIKVDGVEGFVKKVSVRSTQVVTPAQEDIIIPNSDLITHQVVNYMFSDNYWRVKCAIGVAYGSDVEKVEKVMMDVAMSHPEVVKTESNKPMVLFRSFDDSALLFEVWCLIKDVNKKYLVASELNFALDKACRENNITIAFPQRDVHVKFEQQDLPWIKKEPDIEE